MRNVRERMEVLYGERAEVEMISRPGRGTKVTLRMPLDVLRTDGRGLEALAESR